MFIMANNEKIKERLETEKQRIEKLVGARDQLFIERDNIADFGEKKREKIRAINEKIKDLNQQLREIERKLMEEKPRLQDEFKKITKIKGKKDLLSYEINGEKLTVHVAINSKGKFYNIVSEINLNNELLAYFKENVTIKEDGIVSQFKIGEEEIAKMSLEEKLAYYNELCAKMSNPKIVRDPAKSVTLGKRYCLVNECDLDVYIESLNRYRDTLIELAIQNKDEMKLKAAQILANQSIKVEDAELSSFHIDWDLVNSFKTLEERTEYFNTLAKEIAASPKIDTIKVPLGKNASAIVNKWDEMIFLQCFSEYSKAKRAIAASKNPSYTIDWDYVNSLESAEKRAEYFENLCGKIDAVEKFETVTIPYRNHSFVINKIDAEIFKQAIGEFEKNYLQAVREKRQEELARIEEEKRREEARIEAERLEKVIAESKRLEEEKQQALELANRAEMEKLEALAKEAEIKAPLEPNTEEIVSTTLAAIEDKVETRKHANERDQDDELLFISNGGQEIETSDRARDIKSAEDALNSLDNLNFADGDEEIDFFDEEDEEEEEIIEDDGKDKDSENNSDRQPKDDIHAIAEELGGTVSIVNGIEMLDLSSDEEDKDKDKDKEEDKKDDKDDNDKDDGKKHPLRDFFKGKIGKGKKKDKQEQISTYKVDKNADLIDIELEDEDVLKVLNTRGFIGNISESKLYTTKKELYLFIMDLIADQKITNKVTISTKRHTVEIDAKYEDIYTFIANRYEKLEDKYELIAADKYHDLKVKFACGSAVVACGAILLLTAGRGLFAGNGSGRHIDVIPDQINYEVENDAEGSLINTTGYDGLSKVNAMISEDDEELQLQGEDESKIEIIEEQSPNSSSSSRNTNAYETSTYTYTGMEAFNMNPSELGISEEEVTDEIRREAEANSTPLLNYVR